MNGLSDNPLVVKYKDINDYDNKINIDEESFKSKDINMIAFYNLIQELAEMVPDVENNDNQNINHISFQNNSLNMNEEVKYLDWGYFGIFWFGIVNCD